MVFSGKCWVGLCLLVFFLFSVPSAVNVGVEVVTVSVAAVIPGCAHHRVIGVTIAVLLLVATLASFVLCGCGIDAHAVTNQIFVLFSSKMFKFLYLARRKQHDFSQTNRVNEACTRGLEFWPLGFAQVRWFSQLGHIVHVLETNPLWISLTFVVHMLAL